MALFGSLQTVRSQLRPHPILDAAWAYLEHVLDPGSAAHRRILALSTGTTERVDLIDGAFALEQAYQTRRPGESFLESHRKFIDIQVVVRGVECMEVVDVALLAVREDLLEKRDLLFYQPFEHVSKLRIQEGEAAVFFPADGHLPSLAVGDVALVHKTVVKIPVDPVGLRG